MVWMISSYLNSIKHLATGCLKIW